jgi:hypothetical protein
LRQQHQIKKSVQQQFFHEHAHYLLQQHEGGDGGNKAEEINQIEPQQQKTD